MMDAGRSFSGNERNCFFINLGNGKFSDISGISGLDYPDDGRAISTTDWDGDGDIDMWISNRNGPRLRLMKNDAQQDNSFISILLKGNGTTVNKDAIGARVAIIRENNSDSSQQIQTLRAGQGFLSQSSKWIHFGLNKSLQNISIRINWPDKSIENIKGIKPNNRYIIEQGNPVAKSSSIRSEKIKLPFSPALKKTPSQIARVPAITLFKGPKINLTKNGIKLKNDAEKKHQLLNLWATWCGPCLQEMAQFRDQKEVLTKNGIELIALNVDGLGQLNSKSKKPSEVIKSLEFPFPSVPANESLMNILQRIHDQNVGLNEPLPIPSSFLINPDGNVSVIYKGQVSVKQIIEDTNHSSKGLIERIKESSQLAGSIINHPEAIERLFEHEASLNSRHAKNWFSAGEMRGAIHHYEKASKLNPKSKEILSNLAKCYFNLATQMDKQKMTIEALQFYKKGLNIQPQNSAARNNLSWILATSSDQKIRNPKEALRIASKLNADTKNKVPQILDTLAAAQAASGQFDNAVESALIAISKLKNNTDLKKNIQNRLNLYKQKKALSVPIN